MPWMDCEVKQAGPGEFGNMNILLKNKSEEKWYKSDPSIAQSVLLVALAAITHKKGVNVGYYDDKIVAFYLKA